MPRQGLLVGATALVAAVASVIRRSVLPVGLVLGFGCAAPAVPVREPAAAAVDAAHSSAPADAAHSPAPADAAPAPLERPDQACAAPSVLYAVPDVLADPGHPCRLWIEATHGRALRQTIGSAAVWTRRTPGRTAVLVSAVHTLGEGWFGAPGEAVPERLEPRLDDGVARLIPHGVDGRSNEAVSPLFDLYQPPIPAKESRRQMRDILPRHDFFVAVLDSQRRVVAGGLVEVPGPFDGRPTLLHDPHGLTLAAPTYADPQPGDRVLLLGAPSGQELHASIGRVLGDDEVGELQAALRRRKDEEGAVAYDPDVEFWVLGRAVSGMSGGGAFDESGRLLGVNVRATAAVEGRPVVRVVRMRHVVSRLRAARAGLSDVERRRVDAVLGALD